jgi:hypothetical protein
MSVDLAGMVTAEEKLPQSYIFHHKFNVDYPGNEPSLRGENPVPNRSSFDTS